MSNGADASRRRYLSLSLSPSFSLSTSDDGLLPRVHGRVTIAIAVLPHGPSRSGSPLPPADSWPPGDVDGHRRPQLHRVRSRTRIQFRIRAVARAPHHASSILPLFLSLSLTLSLFLPPSLPPSRRPVRRWRASARDFSRGIFKSAARVECKRTCSSPSFDEGVIGRGDMPVIVGRVAYESLASKEEGNDVWLVRKVQSYRIEWDCNRRD